MHRLLAYFEEIALPAEHKKGICITQCLPIQLSKIGASGSPELPTPGGKKPPKLRPQNKKPGVERRAKLRFIGALRVARQISIRYS
jgi:hypothetical protein